MDGNASPRQGQEQQRWQPRCQGVCLIVLVLTSAVKYPRSGQLGNSAVQCKQARRLLTLSTQLGRLPPTTARQDPPALQKANGMEANPRHTQDRPVIAAACQTHVLHKFNSFLPIPKKEQRSDVL